MLTASIKNVDEGQQLRDDIGVESDCFKKS